jgi:hypothetical protein
MGKGDLLCKGFGVGRLQSNGNGHENGLNWIGAMGMAIL